MVNRKRMAVFLDRDGTINEQMGYLNHLSRFVMLPRAAEGIRLLNKQSIPVFVVTNQSGLARGYFPPSLLDEIHAGMNKMLAAEGAKVDGIYICPHHPEAKEDKYRLVCNCRKPKTGLFLQAAAEHDIDLTESFVVGDRWSDLKAASAFEATGILVLTGYGRGDRDYIGPTQSVQPAHVAKDLYEAADWIISKVNQK